MVDASFLQNEVSFLEGLTAEQAEHLASHAERQDFNGGQTVLFRWTTVDGLYVIQSGRVGVWAKPEKSKTLVEVAVLGPGDVFGETSIVDNTTAGATIKAAEEGATLYVIPQEAFRDILAQNPALAARARALIDSRKKKDP